MKNVSHETYVSYETAKLLKQAGFDWECEPVQVKLGEFEHLPTLQVARKWLKEVKNYAIYPTYGGYKIYVLDKNNSAGFSKTYTLNSNLSYEKALEAGIEKCLKIILEKSNMKNWITKPFDLRLAKDIQSGKVEGRFVTKDKQPVRILCFDALNEYPIIALVYNKEFEDIHSYFLNGSYNSSESRLDLLIEVPEETPKHKFKPFDKVLVRMNNDCYWVPRFFAQDEHGYCRDTNGSLSPQCIPYEGNEHLVGTTDKPKEEL